MKGTKKSTVVKKPAMHKKPAMIQVDAPMTKNEAEAQKLVDIIDMTDVFSKLRAKLKSPSVYRNQITSGAFNNARSRAQKAGASEGVAKAFAAIQSNKASIMWAKRT